MKVVSSGDIILVHYTGRLSNGVVFDTSSGRDPLEFVAGGDMVIPGVSRAVLGMSLGESKTVRVSPEDGYGSAIPELVHRVPRGALPEEAKVGDRLVSEGEHEIAFVLKELTDEDALIDGNHPLADELLEFDLLIVSIKAE